MGVPDPCDYYISCNTEQIDGININVDYATPERIERVHKEGGLIGVWYSNWRRQDAWSPMNYLTEKEL